MRLLRTPLALKNLTHNKRRLAVAMVGVGFAVVLVFMQLGFRGALLKSTVEVIRTLDADLILVRKDHFALPAIRSFDRQRILQARSCPGVASARPLYYVTPSFAFWNPAGDEDRTYPIRVLAFDLEEPVFDIPEVADQLDVLAQPDTALFDIESKNKYNVHEFIDKIHNQRGAELSDRHIRLAGRFSLGTDFAHDGTIIMSATNFAKYFPYRVPGGDPLSRVDLGIVQLNDREDVALASEVRRRLNDLLPEDVEALAKDEFIDKELTFWRTSTPIGTVFFIGVCMGCAVGMIVCYQIICSEIADHLAEFATLKAMGYTNWYFIGVVVQTAVLLSLFSYVPGLVIGFGLYCGLEQATGLMMELDLQRALVVLALTLGMCVASGCLAIRKLLTADPASLF
jgi:putative ABC transport system permease protein